MMGLRSSSAAAGLYYFSTCRSGAWQRSCICLSINTALPLSKMITNIALNDAPMCLVLPNIQQQLGLPARTPKWLSASSYQG